MKKRQLAIVLASCFLVSSMNPLPAYAEFADELVSVSEEETYADLSDEAVVTEEGETEESKEIEYVMDDSESAVAEEQLIDTQETAQAEEYTNENDQIALYDGETDGYTQVKTNVPIEFKYEGTTLYFRLQKGAAPTAMPDNKRVSAAKWVNGHETEAKNVTTIVIGEGITALGNHNFEGTYNNCFPKLNEVKLYSTVSKIGDYTFQNDAALQSITNLSNVTSIGDTALKGTGLTNVSLSETQTTTLSDSAFKDCTALTSVTGYDIKLAANVFENCSSLTSFQCQIKPEEIPDLAFSGAKNLTSFDFENVKSIGSKAFSYSGLNNILFKETDMTIGAGAFNGCNDLSAICYPGTKDAWTAISGSAKLEITLASGLKKTVTVKVQTKTVATKKISGLSKTVTLKKGAKMNLKPVVTPATSQQKVTYKSSNKKIVTVSKSGKIKGVKKGKATITVKSGKITKKIKVTVK